VTGAARCLLLTSFTPVLPDLPFRLLLLCHAGRAACDGQSAMRMECSRRSLFRPVGRQINTNSVATSFSILTTEGTENTEKGKRQMDRKVPSIRDVIMFPRCAPNRADVHRKDAKDAKKGKEKQSRRKDVQSGTGIDTRNERQGKGERLKVKVDVKGRGKRKEERART
jgi:hypothetical protein